MVQRDNKVSIIMVDYPSKQRLKIFAKARIVEIADDPDPYKKLGLEGYAFRPERMMTFDVEAYDWNCPQHIIQRYTLEDIESAFASQREEIARLHAEIAMLKQKA